MTTIAFKKGIMVCDGQITDDENTICMQNFCKIKWCGTKLVGIAGSLDEFELVWQWFTEGCDKKDTPTGDWEALVYDASTRELILYESNHKKIIIPSGNYAAIGCGSVPAMVAMYCGKGAKQAVRIAALHNANTGGEIFEFKVGSE